MSVDLKPLLAKSKSALIVWDVQEALVSSIFNKEEFIRNLVELVKSARTQGVPIFYTKITRLPERFQNKITTAFRRGGFDPGGIIKDVEPMPEDIVINKNTASLFVGTNFELMSRNAGVTTLVVAGIATNFGVETSARHASALGYLPVVAKDAVSSSDRAAHERSLENMKLLFPVLSVREIIDYWK